LTVRHFFKIILFFICAITVLITANFALPGATTQAADSTAECWGVFIGISTFQNLDDEVKYAASGQQELCNGFSAVWGADHVRLVTDSEATKSGIMEAIAWLDERADGNDTVLFSVTSTGVAGPGPDYYFWTYDSLPDSWDNDISAEEMDTAFEAIDAAGAVFILSFAHAGGFLNNLSGSNRVILAGCEEDEWGYYDDSLENPVFIYHIIEALNSFGEVDVDSNYAVTAEEIFNYAAPATTSFDESRGYLPAQHPVLDDHFDGELPLIAEFALFTNINLPAGAIITIGGVEYDILPAIFLTAPGIAYTVTVPDVIYIGSDTRYVFSDWDDGDVLTTRAMPYGVHTANFNKEYLLKIYSAYGEAAGDGWYQDGEEVNVFVVAYQELIIKHVFNGWTGDFTGQEADITITMDSPKVITAMWSVEYLNLYILLAILAILIAGIFLTIFLVIIHRGAKKHKARRKKQRRSAK